MQGKRSSHLGTVLGAYDPVSDPSVKKRCVITCIENHTSQPALRAISLPILLTVGEEVRGVELANL